jgi:DNA-binding response OmpR family regulator
MESAARKKILVIDDNQDVLDLLEDDLTAEGYEVVTAGDGLDGLRALKRDRPDLIIIDIMMPQISGPGVMTLIGEREHYQDLRNIPTIVISARSNIDFVREEGLNISEGDYLVKPVDFDRLHEVVAKKLAGS